MSLHTRGRQTVGAVIGLPDQTSSSSSPAAHRARAEDLLPSNAHLVGHVGEECRQVEVAALQLRVIGCAPHHQPRALRLPIATYSATIEAARVTQAAPSVADQVSPSFHLGESWPAWRPPCHRWRDGRRSGVGDADCRSATGRPASPPRWPSPHPHREDDDGDLPPSSGRAWSCSPPRPVSRFALSPETR